MSTLGVKKDEELSQKYKQIAKEMQKDLDTTKSLTFQEGLE